MLRAEGVSHPSGKNCLGKSTSEQGCARCIVVRAPFPSAARAFAFPVVPIPRCTTAFSSPPFSRGLTRGKTLYLHVLKLFFQLRHLMLLCDPLLPLVSLFLGSSASLNIILLYEFIESLYRFLYLGLLFLQQLFPCTACPQALVTLISRLVYMPLKNLVMSTRASETWLRRAGATDMRDDGLT